VSSPYTVLIYAINRTDSWWKHVGNNLGFAENVVVTDIRGAGDCDVVDDFYTAYRQQYARNDIEPLTLSNDEVNDVIARCRLLRWLPVKQARCMVVAMDAAFTRVLDRVQPSIVLSFPIDRYVSDVLERLVRRRGVPYLELTVSLISGMCMLMYRGQLVKSGPEPSAEVVQQQVATIADPEFTPAYVQRGSRYTRARWLKVFCKFRLRGWVFKLISWAKRDPINLHYLDAQAFLGHKPRLSDLSVLDLIDWQWRDRLAQFSKERRVFFGLQLLPEASIDYWLANRELIDYEDLLVEAAKAFSAAGWLVLVKDHPSQFGFRQRELLDRLLALPNVVFLPYDVSGNEVVSLVDVNFTLTGTLGLQSALLGRTSIVSPTYYVTAPDFLTFEQRREVSELPTRAAQWQASESLPQRQARILSHLLQGSFDGDFFSFRGFRCDAPNPAATALAGNLGTLLRALLPKSS
jgi:hypothetical protein